jgi:murein DD-endopeptidase MepM/ murein hydrolase activator NlpD
MAENNKNQHKVKTLLKRGMLYFCLVLASISAATGSFAKDFEDNQASQSDNSASGDTSSFSSQEQLNFMKRLNDELNISKAEYYQITTNIRETRNKINSLKEDMSKLQNQLTYFDDQIETTTEKLITVIKQLVRTENEIKILYEEIDVKQTALEYQKQLLKDYIQKLYVYGDTYFDYSENGEVDAFKLLLADSDTGDVLKEMKYLGILKETGDRLVENLDGIVTDLGNARQDLEKKRVSLAKLESEIQTQKNYLSVQKAAKENMLALTKNQDEIYRSLLQQSMQQQEESIAEMRTFKESIAFIEQKMKEEGAAFDISKYEDFVGKKFMTLYEFQKTPASSEGFIWPVLPNTGLSAYFHDESYRGYFGVQHNAVDIRTPQGTPVAAAADGVVYKVKDNDYGYSYIIVIHHDNLMTTYGHISNMMATEGQVVKAGDIIGLSGGMPGTKGAGYMTTGPHLHFEVMKDGSYVDPLRFLPLEILTEENVKNLPSEYQDDWQRAVLESEYLKEPVQ